MRWNATFEEYSGFSWRERIPCYDEQSIMKGYDRNGFPLIAEAIVNNLFLLSFQDSTERGRECSCRLWRRVAFWCVRSPCGERLENGVASNEAVLRALLLLSITRSNHSHLFPRVRDGWCEPCEHVKNVVWFRVQKHTEIQLHGVTVTLKRETHGKSSYDKVVRQVTANRMVQVIFVSDKGNGFQDILLDQW